MSISQDSIPRSGASLAAAIAAAGFAVPDDKFSITGSSDATKTIKFEADAMTANDDLTINSGAQTDDRTVTLPVLAGAANFVMREAALTDNAVIRADGTTGLIQNTAVIVDDSNNVSGVGTLGCGAITTTGNFAQTGAATTSTGTGTQTLNGNVVVTTGKTITAVTGIIFSNETLSQYDEGAWTPTIFGSGTAGTPTYSDQSGTYTRIGRDCLFQYRVAITAKTGIAGNVAIGGLPFTINASFNASLGIGYYAGLTFGAGRTQLIGLGIAGTTSFLLQACGSAVAAASITDADLAASTELIGCFHFRI